MTKKKDKHLTVEQLQPLIDKINSITPQEIIDNACDLEAFLQQIALENATVKGNS